MCLRILTTHKYLMQNNSIKTAASHSGFWFRVNSYMLPHRHCTGPVSGTDSGRNCIGRRIPVHNRWNRRMSCRLCGHSLRYCREEVCFLLHYPYIPPPCVPVTVHPILSTNSMNKQIPYILYYTLTEREYK